MSGVPCFRVPASKSELIRALILQSFESSIQINGASQCEDVLRVQNALREVQLGADRVDLGDSGLGFRSLAFRISRLKTAKTILLTGSRRLLSRPHAELQRVLETLGVGVIRSTEGFHLTPPSRGQWKNKTISVSGAESSQFASGLLLSSWGLDDGLELQIERPIRSQGYLELTLQFLKEAGLAIESASSDQAWVFKIPPLSLPKPQTTLTCDGDWSTAAALAAVGLVRETLEIEGLSQKSLQPDRAFVRWFSEMGGRISWVGDRLRVERSRESLRGITVSGGDAPDLIPVFSALASIAEGRSEIHSAPQLRFKESNRVSGAVRLARFLRARAEETSGGFWIEPTGYRLPQTGAWSTDHDHRQVHAGFVALAAGASFSFDQVGVVTKSSPEFLDWMKKLGIDAEVRNFVFVGHRGTGKTSYSQRLAQAFGVECVDLDQEIERASQQSIQSIFSSHGEASFRAMENQQIDRILAEPVPSEGRIIVAGAGMEFEFKKKRPEIVWISRESDSFGRIFSDRPRLDPELTALEEFQSRAQVRERRYEALSDRRVILAEGAERWSKAQEAEGTLLFGLPDFQGASITIPKSWTLDLSRLQKWLDLRLGWGFRFFEIREDYFSDDFSIEQAQSLIKVLSQFPPDRWLWSRRTPRSTPGILFFERYLMDHGVAVDWALELGESPRELKNIHFLSSHEGIPPSGNSSGSAVVKWSPQVRSWAELRRGHEWWMESKTNRVFLPRSDQGLWRYYRLWSARSFSPALYFLRESEGSAPDQPTLLSWLQNPGIPKEFGAVLGDPIFHSRSPERHGPHFYAFQVTPEEWRPAVEFLMSIGLKRAAITSPLKEVAFQWLKNLGERGQVLSPADQLQSINTLEWHGDGVSGKNTDFFGLKRVLTESHVSPTDSVILWGGGGTSAMIRELLPQVVEYSARSGEARHGDSDCSPDVLIWAVGRKHFTGIFPPQHWQPKVILDLNYSEDSPGREYAQRLGSASRYISGHRFFEAQAEVQFSGRAHPSK